MCESELCIKGKGSIELGWGGEWGKEMVINRSKEIRFQQNFEGPFLEAKCTLVHSTRLQTCHIILFL